ncbi:D-alanyl-D-alanine carboxypeptidase/D-alanyl-D-alanine-endopeptidase [Salinimicrobium terrae]|uniref:D-alanyl-D-alanine carboxypeptidase/D-alanyl-D-alanine-endopeptidase n=1 Tax=Salinimicrobium terrae TaxID=470866 RepID=UPI00041B5D91|nr:D-alanyl-D-alanine carboxypeptidase [Salinimicrobium terrae]
METEEFLQKTNAFDTGFQGFVLYDPEKEEIIYDHNGDKYFTPASNTKLFTFYTGLKILGDSIPALKYTIHHDSLVFWGTGDPSFLHKEFEESNVLSFLQDRQEHLFYAAPKYSEEHFGPGWSWDDYNWYYSAERGAFPMYGNTVNFKFDPGENQPGILPTHFKDSLIANSGYTGKSSTAYRDRSKNRFLYKHQIGNEEEEQEVPFIYSENLVVELLRDTLNKEIEKIREVPDHFPPAKTIYSIPSDSLYKRMLQVSDNFIAEQLLMMSAQQISDSLKAENAIQFMKKNHLQDLPDEPIWVDGSGLSNYNKFTPRSVVKLLEKIQEEVPMDRLFELLPAGGESGTIKNWYKAEEPYIFAKTGTLSNAHMLSGFLRTKEGKVLIFSFMNNNYTVPSSEIKRGMEKILRNIYLNY